MVWVEGALQPRTLAGPSTFAAWDQHWAVFATAMLALGASAVGPLDRYRTGINDLQLLFPHLWGLISRADEAMRGEQWKRMGAEFPPGGDWSLVIAGSAYSEEGSRQWWWDRHVVKPAATTTPHAVVNALEGYTPRGATLVPPLGRAGAGGDRGLEIADEPAGRKRKRRGLAPGGRALQDQSPPAAAPRALQDLQPSAPKRGPCFDFNAGRCARIDEPCPKGFPHGCVVCGGRHAACDEGSCKDKVNAKGMRSAGKGGGKSRK